MSKKEKAKDKKKDKRKEILKRIKAPEDRKSSCCEKYKKGEKNRCSRCPMFDLLKKSA